MTYDPERHHRRSVRLHDYDYSQAGAYFVTVVAQDRACLFGEVVDGEMRLSDAGLVILSWWWYLPGRFPGIGMDAAVVMPNHLHGIVLLGTGGWDDRGYSDMVGGEQGAHTGAPLPAEGVGWSVTPSLGAIVQWFKTMTTNDYIRGVKADGWPPFRGRLWHRSYYEHVIRSDHALDRIRSYIVHNPARWTADEENPARLDR